MLGSIEQLGWDVSQINPRGPCAERSQAWTRLQPSWKAPASLFLMTESPIGVLLSPRFSRTRATDHDLCLPTQGEVPSVPENLTA